MAVGFLAVRVQIVAVDDQGKRELAVAIREDTESFESLALAERVFNRAQDAFQSIVRDEVGS